MSDSVLLQLTGSVYQTQSALDNALIDGNITVTTTGVVNFTASASASSRSVTRPIDEVGS